VIGCGEGSLCVTELQKSGGRRLSVAEFLRGHMLICRPAGATAGLKPPLLGTLEFSASHAIYACVTTPLPGDSKMFGNWLKTSILMAGIVALFGVVGAAIGGQQGMLLALLFGGAMNVWAYWFSDKMVLRMYNAREVDAASSPYLYNMVAELAQRAGCRCRASTSSTRPSRTPSPPAAIRKMLRWRPPPASSACCRRANCAA
jgi:hypothetical protein